MRQRRVHALNAPLHDVAGSNPNSMGAAEVRMTV